MRGESHRVMGPVGVIGPGMSVSARLNDSGSSGKFPEKVKRQKLGSIERA